MREVLVPATFALCGSSIRRPIVLLAIALIVLQSVVAGLATAQAGALLAPNPADAGVICHGTGGDPADTTDTAKIWHVCCVSCTAAAPAMALPQEPVLARLDLRGEAGALVMCGGPGFVARRAVRDGLSQAPPSGA
jgi:hypothetical protein